MDNNSINKTIRLGLMPPLTGLVKLYGPEISMAAKIACAEINAAGGVLGKPLEIIIEDDGSLPETAVPAAEKLVIEHQCTAIIGNLLSNSRISVATLVAEPYQIPYLNFSFYEGSISSPYFFHFAALPNQQIEKMIPYMAEQFGPKFYFAGNNYEWPRGSIDAAKNILHKVGGEVVGEEYFDIGTDEFDKLLQRVAASGADVFVPYAAGSDQLALLTQFHEHGLKERMAVVMGHYDEAMVQLLSPEVRDDLFSSNTYFMSADTLENRGYLKQLKEQKEITGIHPQGNGVLTNFGEGTYLCVKAFAQAANSANSIETKDLLAALKNIELRSPQGRVKMDPTTQHATVNCYLSQCQADGSFQIIKSFGSIEPEIPQRYRKVAVNSHRTKEDTFTIFDPHTSAWQFIGTISLQNKKIVPEASTMLTGSLTLSAELIDYLSSHYDQLQTAINSGIATILPEPLDSASASSIEVAVEPLKSDEKIARLAIFSSYSNRTFTSPTNHTLSLPTGNQTIGMALLSENMRITYANDIFVKNLNYNNEAEAIGTHITNLCSSAQQALEMHETAQAGGFWKGEIFFAFSENDKHLLQVKIELISNTESRNAAYLVTCINPLQQHYITSQDEHILMSADAAILAVNEDGNIIQANPTASQYFGYPPADLIGLSLHLLIPPHLREKHHEHLNDFIHSSYQSIPMGRRGSLTGYRKDGTFFPLEASISKFSNNNQTILVATLHDLTEQMKVEENLLWQATHDPLTRLPNRTLMTERLEKSLARTEVTQKFSAVIFIDLDGFKLINDNYGHETGDDLLLEISKKLLTLVRPGDTVGRFGGDEFIIICDQLEDQSTVDELAKKIVATFQDPINLINLGLYSTVSIGIALGDHRDAPKDLLRNADAAMYHVKDNGRDGWTYFNSTIADKSKEVMQISYGLRNAIDNNELHLVFQPIIDIQSHTLMGSEALLRWKKDGKLIPPDIFIQIAEKNGSIHNIGEWVFHQACLAQVSWQSYFSEGACPYTSINLSAKQLDSDDLVARFQKIISETGVNPNNLLLEITETSFVSDIDILLDKFHRFTALGLRLAIDDFGTGYSSLSQLMSFPAYLLKIDKSFVDNIATHEESFSLTTTIANMAKALNLKITAEGVETIEQLELLDKMGCDNAQGYYFYKPMRYDDYFQLITKDREHAVNTQGKMT